VRRVRALRMISSEEIIRSATIDPRPGVQASGGLFASLGQASSGSAADVRATRWLRQISSRQRTSERIPLMAAMDQTRPKLDVRAESALLTITDIVVYPSQPQTKLPHNRRWRRVRDERAALVRLNLSDRVKLPVHPRELGFSFSIGI
jgi:hypothetical protein